MTLGVILGIVLAMVGLPGQPSEAALAEFDRIQQHIGRDVILVDTTGLVMEGRVVAATSSTLDLGFGAHVRSFPADGIARVDRQRDSPIDGLVKGLVIGAVMGALSRNARWTGALMSTYGGLGLALDANHQAREPIYRAPDPKRVTMQATIRW
jgi:hypothetical protein